MHDEGQEHEWRGGTSAQVETNELAGVLAPSGGPSVNVDSASFATMRTTRGQVLLQVY